MIKFDVTLDNADEVLAKLTALVAIGACADRFHVDARCAACGKDDFANNWRIDFMATQYGLKHSYSCVGCGTDNQTFVYKVREFR